MAYYRICPECGAALDPGERCDCRYFPCNKAPTNARFSALRAASKTERVFPIHIPKTRQNRAQCAKTINGGINMDALTAQEYLREQICKADKKELLYIKAIIYTVLIQRHDNPPEDYSKGRLKREIRRFRIAQKEYPELAEDFEESIMLIRNNWLRKAA